MRCSPTTSLVGLLFADDRDLLFCLFPSFERERPDLYPDGFGWPGLNDFALLRRLLLNDIILSTRFVALDGGLSRPHRRYDGSRVRAARSH